MNLGQAIRTLHFPIRGVINERRVVVDLLRVNVTNTGMIAGDEVVLASVTPPRTSLKDPSPPIKQLFGFERVHLNANETAEVFFPFYVNARLTTARDGSKCLESELQQIVIGPKLMHKIELRGDAVHWS